MFLIQSSAPSKQVWKRILKNIDNGTLTPTELETDDTIIQLQAQVVSLTKAVMQWQDRHRRMEARERATIEFVQVQMDKQCQEANEHIETWRRRFEAKEKSLQLEHTKEMASIKQEIVAEQAQTHQGILDSLLIKHSKELDLLKEEISIRKAVCNWTKPDEISYPPTIKRTELIWNLKQECDDLRRLRVVGHKLEDRLSRECQETKAENDQLKTANWQLQRFERKRSTKGGESIAVAAGKEG